MPEYIFKIADQHWEFDQIHRLNYETFVKEIPQHQRNSEGVLVDKFHGQNTYIISIQGDEVVGMIAVRDERPFSLDQKLGDFENYLPLKGGRSCEIRLLSIRKDRRFSKIIGGLFTRLAKFCESNSYDLALISATTKQLKLYKNLGFRPFGPLVGTNGAKFQPMYLTMDSYMNFKTNSKMLGKSAEPRPAAASDHAFLFLPGPVEVRPEVKKEFEKPPVSHRSADFIDDFRTVRGMLCSLANSASAEITMGSGTLANDMIAGQLSLEYGRGLILSNGEFGERLIDHARRFRLDFETVKAEWGSSFDMLQIRESIISRRFNWVWMVHCETSTGVLNDIDAVKEICLQNGVKLCLDCISSIGNVELDLQGVFLASGVSGKGLASYPGLCFVFYNHDINVQDRALPRYLDLGYFSSCGGSPFTFSSNHLYALKRSIELLDVESKFSCRQDVAGHIRSELEKAGVEVLGCSETCSPAVITFRLPDSIDSAGAGAELEENGYYISYRSEYLLERNLMQIALMGEIFPERIGELLELITKIAKRG